MLRKLIYTNCRLPIGEPDPRIGRVPVDRALTQPRRR
jgi:hypothetical protein